MLSLGFGELMLVAVVLLVVVGPERIPKVMRYLGSTYGQLRRAADDLRRAFVLEADRQDAEERFQMLKERREQARRQREEASRANPGVVSQEARLPKPPDVGVSADEWASMPEHVRALVLKGLEAEKK